MGTKENNRQGGTGTLNRYQSRGSIGQHRHVSNFFLGGDTSNARNIARSLTKSAESIKLQRKKSNLRNYPTLDVLRDCKFVFVRYSTDDQKFLSGSFKSYEIMDSLGKKLFYTKEMEGMGRRNSLGALTDKIFCLLALDGTELLRMEGGTFSSGKMGEFLSCFRGTMFIGDIIEKVQRCPSRSYIIITDEKQIQVAHIQKDLVRDKKCCLMKIFSSSRNGRITSRRSNADDASIFKILVPETQGKMGSMGKISKFYSELPRSLDDCFGVELPVALGNPEKTLLLASIFMLYRPEPIESCLKDK
ncbi:unnamed protein product [Allacma fusca]|uniref:Phospholipid scramblase n=1 Tax=Allacma fusca TaxID=39272 RepID=A0A8J2PCR3_9HEXA|nr:unnamed protein product [Allacma fusca]